MSGYNADPADLPRGDPERVGGGEGVVGHGTDGTDPSYELGRAQDVSRQHHRAVDTHPRRPLRPRRQGGHVGHSHAAAQQGIHTTSRTTTTTTPDGCHLGFSEV